MRAPPSTGHPRTLAWLPLLPRCRNCLEAGLTPQRPVPGWGGGALGVESIPWLSSVGCRAGGACLLPALLRAEQRRLVSLLPRRWRRCLVHGSHRTSGSVRALQSRAGKVAARSLRVCSSRPSSEEEEISETLPDPVKRLHVVRAYSAVDGRAFSKLPRPGLGCPLWPSAPPWVWVLRAKADYRPSGEHPTRGPPAGPRAEQQLRVLWIRAQGRSPPALNTDKGYPEDTPARISHLPELFC